MPDFTSGGKTYRVDEHGFLLDHDGWDEDFATGMAKKIGVEDGLTAQHWKVIHFIRDYFGKHQRCPLVYEAGRDNRLFLRDFKRLFPAGYMRGACKLAGITYEDRFINFFGEDSPARRWHEPAGAKVPAKSYRIDPHGYLIDPAEWDQDFAQLRATELKIGKLTEKHWRLIDYLRQSFAQNAALPTVFNACEANNLDLPELERLFPDGYNRGAIKIAGLRPI